MAFTLNSRIKIGNYTFAGGVSELVIKKNIHVIVDTAKLTIPGLGRIVKASSVVNNALSIIGLGSQPAPSSLPVGSVQTAKLFNEGDPVAIDLGYNGRYNNEFRGFVRRVNLTTPITIDIEGYAWQLRRQNILASWKITTVRDVLERIIEGTDIILSPDIPVITLTNFYLRNVDGLKALEYLITHMLLTVCFADNMLYVGIEEGRTTAPATLGGLADVKYSIGFNCPSNQPDLKVRLGADNLVRVRLKVKGKNGKNTLYEAGDTNGMVVDKIIPFSNDIAYLQATAAAYLKKLKYNGYEGKIDGLLEPICQPGWKATLYDKRYSGARAGTYFVPGVEVTFGVKGARRKVDISYRLDAPQ